MSSYKVLQDIEAEDKLIGPLTLKQFGFAFAASLILFVGWLIGRAIGQPILLVLLFVIPASPFIFLAAPLGRDQPNDVWLASRVRFFFKPRIRKWNQSGIQNLVTITVPKKIEHLYTDGLSRVEVSSRLKLLANTIDSRGWATKNVNLNLNPVLATVSADRLVTGADMPDQVSELDIKPWDDVLDSKHSAVGQHMQVLIDEHSNNARADAIARMQSSLSSAQSTIPAPSATGITHPAATTPASASSTADEQAFLKDLHSRQERMGINPKNTGPPQIIKKHERAEGATKATVDPQISIVNVAEENNKPKQAPAELEQANINPGVIDQFSRNDTYSVATIASQAKRAENSENSLQDNDVIELH